MHQLDLDTKSAIDLIPMMVGQQMYEAKHIAHERREMLQAGLAMVPDVYQEEIKRFEPLLRLRFDMWNGYFVVDRWIKENNAWMIVLRWIYEDETPRNLGIFSVMEMVEILKAGDTWRFGTPAQYMKYKRDKAAAIQLRRDRESTDAVLAAVDSLSTKSINQFINVERALHTGEKIIAHGSDEKFLENAHQKTLAADAAGVPLDHPAAADNPGMNPLTYKRKYKGRKEIHETRTAR